MNGLAQAERNFDRIAPDFRAEAERQDLIAKAALYESRVIVATLGRDDELAAKVCDDIPGNLMTPTAVEMTRAALKGDATKLLALWLAELDGAVKREAETRAEQLVDELTQ